jgi:sugar phosphate isomerase/epimerase
MRSSFGRRDFLKAGAAVGAGLGLAGLRGVGFRSAAAADAVPEGKLANGSPNAEKIGWRLGCQAYSFNHFTFFDAVDKTASVGLLWIEAYPGQRVSKEVSAQLNESMPAAARKQVKKKLADSGITLVNYGVCGLSNNEGDARRTFDFAKDMGIETIVSEPSEDAFDTIEKLCDEYAINVALHNHPQPSHYWNPDTVLKVCKGRSKRIGACADTGHWMRSKLVPIECLKKLEGRIISFHFKDLNEAGGGHDVPWGTGKGDVKGMLTEILRQKIKAVFSIEYEHNWDNSVPEIAKCVEYFDKVAAELAK